MINNNEEMLSKIEELFFKLIREDKTSSRLKEDTLSYLSRMKSHDPETYFHELRVSLIAVAIAQKFSYLDIRPELYGGANHDVGKIEISRRVLHKENFRDSDYKIIESHAKNGAEKLKNYFFVSLIAGMHHSDQSHPYGMRPSAVVNAPLSESTKKRIFDAVHHVSLADFFDAAINRNSSSRESDNLPPREAILKVYPDFEEKINFLFQSKKVKKIVSISG